MTSLADYRILLVEDDYYLATDACEWLKEAGAEVVGPFASSSQALQLLGGEQVDAAVLDINLGFGPEFEVARHLQRQQVPIVFATGYDASTVPDEFKQSARVEKPFRQAHLVQAVERAVSNRQAEKS